jgi:hypothetical protein
MISDINGGTYIVFGQKRVQETGGWRKLSNDELHPLYSSPSIVRMIKTRGMRYVRCLGRMRRKRKAYRAWVGKPEENSPLGRQRCMWVDYIEIEMKEIKWDGIHWINLV